MGPRTPPHAEPAAAGRATPAETAPSPGVAATPAGSLSLADGTWLFVATWSPPWRALARQLATELDSGVLNVIDVDDQPEVADRWVIRVVPTVLIVRGGREVQRITGALAPARLRRLAGR